MKSIRTDPLNHAPEGDERIRTAVPALGTDCAYEVRSVERPVTYAVTSRDDTPGTLVAAHLRISELQDRIALALTWAPNRPEKDGGSFGNGIEALDELVQLARGAVS